MDLKFEVFQDVKSLSYWALVTLKMNFGTYESMRVFRDLEPIDAGGTAPAGKW